MNWLKRVLTLYCVVSFAMVSFSQETAETEKKYTFDDFFNQLTLPFEGGLAFTNGFPSEKEDMGVFFKTCIEWRHHITYGAYASLEYDTYDCEYNDKPRDYGVADVNAISGEERFHDILIGAGYRVPLVKDFEAYRQNPTYDNVVSFYCGVLPGVSIVNMRTVEVVGVDEYALKKVNTVVPSMKVTAGFEYHPNYTISIYVGASYIQHFKRTPLEQSAMGVWIPSIGLATFF